MFGRRVSSSELLGKLKGPPDLRWEAVPKGYGCYREGIPILSLSLFPVRGTLLLGGVSKFTLEVAFFKVLL